MTERGPVLIVEDNEITAGSIAQVLRWEGYRVLVAGNGEIALRLLRQGERPALILLDLMMPVMDGQEFHRRLREMPGAGAVPVVVITGIDDAVQETCGLQPTAVLTKPFQLDRLVALLSTHARAA